MPAWMEKIKDTFTAKADLKSLFIVLQPDNQVSTVMVVSYVPTDKDSFQVQSPNQKIPDRKTKCVIKTHINIKQNVIFGAKLKPV